GPGNANADSAAASHSGNENVNGTKAQSAGAGAGAGELSGEGYQSAIERQRAAVEAARAAMRQGRERAYGPEPDADEGRPHLSRWAIGAAAVLALLAGAAFLVSPVGRPLQDAWRSAVDGAQRVVIRYQPMPADTAPQSSAPASQNPPSTAVAP